MKHYYVVALSALLCTAPSIVLSGCGGGSSSNNTQNSNRADFVFTNVKSDSNTTPFKVKGLFPDGELPIDVDAQGILVYGDIDRASGDQLSIGVYTQINQISRSLGFGFSIDDATNPTIGYSSQISPSGPAGASYSPSYGAGPIAGYFEAISGTIRVAANNGGYVTFAIKNANFQGRGDLVGQSFVLNGKISYNKSDGHYQVINEEPTLKSTKKSDISKSLFSILKPQTSLQN